MKEAMEAIREGLKKAIRFEGDGHHFYRMAAASTEDPQGREVFTMLAAEELEHVRFLTSQYNSFLENGQVDSSIHLPKHKDLDKKNPIFSENLKKRIKDAHMEMSSLAIGMQLELSSITFYKAEAEKYSNMREVAAFYRELADWEKTHYDALLRQQEELKEDYWSSGGFTPF